MLLRGVLFGGVWNGFLLGTVVGQLVMDTFFFWDCPLRPLVRVREDPELAGLMGMGQV